MGSALQTATPSASGGLMPITSVALVIILAACSSQPMVTPRRTAMPASGAAVVVRLSNFAFAPEHLQLKAGAPVRLRLVNDSSGDHDFSAPSFFATISLQSGSSVPSDGAIEVGPHQTVEVALVPPTPGSYPLECTHFLHSTFGMNGTIEVVP
jgi:uncharacterized cupredoxin-like copper-binding protein